MRNLFIILIFMLLFVIFLFLIFNIFKPKTLISNSISNVNSIYSNSIYNNKQNIIIGVAGSTNQKAMLFAIHSGVNYFREDIGLNSNQEANIKNLSNKGAHFIGILDYETLHLSTPCTSNCSWTLQDWNNTVEEAVKAYPEVHIWEIWNEPQLPIFQSGFQNGDPYNYYLMVKSAYNIIKSYNSSDIILCFGGDNVYTGQAKATTNNSDFQWAYSAWQYGLSNYCDMISLHVYTGDTFLMNQTAHGSNETVGEIISNQLDLYENLTDKPIFITETGISSNNGTGFYNLNNSQYKQNLFLNQAFNLYLSKPYIRGIIWFNLIGYVHPPYNIDFGLLSNLSNNIQPKPAWYTFINYINYTRHK